MKVIWNKNKISGTEYSKIKLSEQELEILVDVWELSWDLDVSEYETSDTDSAFGEDIHILRRLEHKGLVVSEPIHAQLDQFDTRWSATFDDEVATQWDVFWEKRTDNQNRDYPV